jgi:hypothetical protein
MRNILPMIFLVILSSALINIYLPTVSAQTARDQFNSGIEKTAGKMGYNEGSVGGAQSTLAQRIGVIVKVVLSMVGVFFLVLTVYGGFLWMTSRGNEQEVAKARKIIINALIGLAIVLSAYIITAFVGGNIAEPLTS